MLHTSNGHFWETVMLRINNYQSNFLHSNSRLELEELFIDTDI